MIQIQSTWFPFIDRNPQKFVDNIFEAKEVDFIKANHRLYQVPSSRAGLSFPYWFPDNCGNCTTWRPELIRYGWDNLPGNEEISGNLGKMRFENGGASVTMPVQICLKYLLDPHDTRYRLQQLCRSTKSKPIPTFLLRGPTTKLQLRTL